MSGHKSNWSKEELLEIFRIGDKFMASGESYEIILNSSIKAIKAGVIEPRVVCSFNLLKFLTPGTDQFSHELIIDYLDEQLILNGDTVSIFSQESVISYFLAKAKYFDQVVIKNFEIIEEIVPHLRKYLQTRPVSLHSIEKDAVIEPFSFLNFDYYRWLERSNFYFFHNEASKNFASTLNRIPMQSFDSFDIIYPKNLVLLENLALIFEKIIPSRDFCMFGDLDIGLLEMFHACLRKSLPVLKLVPYDEYPKWFASIKLYTSELQKSIDRGLVCKDGELYDEFPKADVDLTSRYQYSFEGEDWLITQFPITSIGIFLNNFNDLMLLSTVLKNNVITSLALSIDSTDQPFQKYDELFELLKSQNKIKSFRLSSCKSGNSVAIDRLLGLMKCTSFASDLEFLNLHYYPFDKVVKILSNPIPKLKKLDL